MRELLLLLSIIPFFLAGNSDAFELPEDDWKDYIEAAASSIHYGLPLPMPIGGDLVGSLRNSSSFAKQGLRLWLNNIIRDLEIRKRTSKGNEYDEISNKLSAYQAFYSCLKGGCDALKQIEAKAGASSPIWFGGTWECSNCDSRGCSSLEAPLKLKLTQYGANVVGSINPTTTIESTFEDFNSDLANGNLQGTVAGRTINLTVTEIGEKNLLLNTLMIATISSDGKSLELRRAINPGNSSFNDNYLRCRRGN